LELLKIIPARNFRKKLVLSETAQTGPGYRAYSNTRHRISESSPYEHFESLEATMFGYGLIGTLVVIILVVWLIRSL